MKERILITGGAGFIGSHLAAYHLDKGDEVWVVDNLSTGTIENIAEFLGLQAFTFDKADITRWPKLDNAVRWANRIYHMAAVVGQFNVIAHPVETSIYNVETTHCVLDAISRVNVDAHFLLASTSSVYYHVDPEEGGALREDAVLHFMSGKVSHETYPLSKLLSEVLTLSYVQEKKVQGTIARIFNTVGTHQSARYGMVVPRFIKQALLGEPITVFGTGEQKRCFMNVHDTVRALDLLSSTPRSIGEIYNVGSQHEYSILELAKLIKERTNSSSEIKFVSYRDAYGIDFCDVTKRYPSIDKLKSLTDFKIRYSMEETVDEVAEYISQKLRGTKSETN